MTLPFTNEITGAGGTLVRNLIKSINYLANQAGWRITKLGDAEFNNLTARGTVTVVDATGREVVLTNNPLAEINLYPAPGPSGYSPGSISAQTDPNGAGMLQLLAPYPAGQVVSFPTLELQSGLTSPAQGGKAYLYSGGGGAADPAGGVFIDGIQACLSTARYSAATPAGTTTSATYVNFTTPALTFTKQYTSTKVNVRFTTVPFLTGAGNTTPSFAININGTDYALGNWQIGPVSTSTTQTFETPVAAGLAAGTYSCNLRWARTAGAGTLNAGGWTSIVMEEVP